MSRPYLSRLSRTRYFATGLTAEELLDRAGVPASLTHGRLRKIEAGHAEPTAAELEWLGSVLNVPVESLRAQWRVEHSRAYGIPVVRHTVIA